MAHQQTLKAGTELIGDFRILDLLGSGGFANTYLAMDITLGREVAIKEFFPSELAVRADSQSVSVKSAAQEVQFKWALGRFVREAKTLAKFRHPSVVRVFRVFNANDTAYIVLEFVRGANMETWLKRIQRRPDQDELDHFLPPLLDALEVVHDAGILHRDIKPANIYIREDERTPVLLDFGAAKYAASNAGDQTATTAAIVSKGYSPHEAYSTDAHLQGPWTDIYGLAATLHRGLTGSAPMESTTRIMQDDFVPLDERPELVGKYRADFLKSLNRALGVMPKDRPQSISEWRAELYPDLSTPGQASASSGAAGGARAEWHPLSDTPSDATTIYTGGSSRPSGVAGSQSPSRATGASVSRDAQSGEKSSVTAATRLAFQNVVKNQSRTVLTGWLLAIAGASGLALPFILGSGGEDTAPKAALTKPAVEVARVDNKTSTPGPTVAPQSDSKPQATPEAARAEALRVKAERQKELDRQQAAEKQREEWQRQRLQLQADAARQRSEEATKLAARRAEERQKAAAEAERARQAKLAEEKRQREEQKRLADEKKAEEARIAAAKAAAEKAAAEARERERIVAETAAAEKRAAEKAAAEKRERERIAKEEELRRQEEEREKQRLAAAAQEREAREKAAAAAREQERLRLARRAELAEKARLEREKERVGTQEQKYAALNPVTPPITPPAELDRKPYLTKVQTALKDAKCYSGSINGELSDTETALQKFRADYKGDAKSLSLQTASANEYDAWLTWFQSLEKFGCITPRENKTFEKPRATKKKRSVRTKPRKKPKAQTKKRAKSKVKKSRPKKKTASTKRSKPKKRTYGAGSTSRSILRGTR